MADTDEIGSIEYGVDHLATPLMVVLGHTHCGAVTAVTTGAELHGSIPALVNNILPAVEAVKKEYPELTGAPLIAKVVEANVWQAVSDLLAKSPATAARVKAGTLKVVGAIYDIEHGAVNWLGELPGQAAILAAPAPAHEAPAAAETVTETPAAHAEAAPAMHEAKHEAPAAHGEAAHAAVETEESGSSLPIILFVIGFFAVIAVMEKTVLKD